MMSMHKLTSGDGYAYLTRQVAAGDAGLRPNSCPAPVTSICDRVARQQPATDR